MRYVILAVVMFNDIVVFAAIGFLIYSYPQSVPIYVISALALFAFYRSGAFSAWRPRDIKIFLRAARMQGL